MVLGSAAPMERFFNTAGPVVAEDNYCLPPLSRWDLDAIRSLIDQKRYFVLHAPRQTGKTSSLLALMRLLNDEGRYRCLYANIEAAQASRGDFVEGIRTVVSQIAQEASIHLGEERLRAWGQEALSEGPGAALTAVLSRWCRASERPVVLLLDEVDALVGDTLISLLRQLRAGYPSRTLEPPSFPVSVVLCGVRDVRDYRMEGPGGEVITGGSAFNVKAKSLRLGNFTTEESRALWLQHTEATGQQFAEAIFPELWEDTWGQPWLVNALAHETTWQDRDARDRSVPITLDRYAAARERLTQSRATHLDLPTDKLREERVHQGIPPILAGERSS